MAHLVAPKVIYPGQISLISHMLFTLRFNLMQRQILATLFCTAYSFSREVCTNTYNVLLAAHRLVSELNLKRTENNFLIKYIYKRNILDQTPTILFRIGNSLDRVGPKQT